MGFNSFILSKPIVFMLLILLRVAIIFFYGVSIALILVCLIDKQRFPISLASASKSGTLEVGVFSCTFPDWVAKGSNAVACPKAADKASGALLVVALVIIVAAFIVNVIFTVVDLVRRKSVAPAQRLISRFFVILVAVYIVGMIISLVGFGMYTGAVMWRENHFPAFLDSAAIQSVGKVGQHGMFTLLGIVGICSMITATIHFFAFSFIHIVTADPLFTNKETEATQVVLSELPAEDARGLDSPPMSDAADAPTAAPPKHQDSVTVVTSTHHSPDNATAPTEPVTQPTLRTDLSKAPAAPAEE